MDQSWGKEKKKKLSREEGKKESAQSEEKGE